MGVFHRFAAASALAAAFSLAAAPAMAHDRWHRWHDDDDIDAGDVIAGVVLLGGIAALAGAFSKHDRQDQPPAPPAPDERQGYGYDGPERDVGLDHAAGMCVDAIERGRDRVDTVDNVTRDRDGWAVSGLLTNGSGFSCRIGNDGRVDGVRLAAPRAEAAPGQYSDDYYARARGAQDTQVGADVQPAQPGGDTPPAWVAIRPEWHGTAPQAAPRQQVQPQASPQPQDDGRYSTSQAPDFSQTI